MEFIKPIQILPIILAITSGIISLVAYLKLYYYLKERKPKILKSLTNTKAIVKSPFEFSNLHPIKFLHYISSKHQNDDEKSILYKRLYLIFLILTIVFFFYAFFTLSLS